MGHDLINGIQNIIIVNQVKIEKICICTRHNFRSRDPVPQPPQPWLAARCCSFTRHTIHFIYSSGTANTHSFPGSRGRARARVRRGGMNIWCFCAVLFCLVLRHCLSACVRARACMCVKHTLKLHRHACARVYLNAHTNTHTHGERESEMRPAHRSPFFHKRMCALVCA